MTFSCQAFLFNGTEKRRSRKKIIHDKHKTDNLRQTISALNRKYSIIQPESKKIRSVSEANLAEVKGGSYSSGRLLRTWSGPFQTYKRIEGELSLIYWAGKL